MLVSTEPVPDLSADQARELSEKLSRASVDIFSLALARQGASESLRKIADLPGLEGRLRACAFALLDAAGWPPLPGDLDDEYTLTTPENPKSEIRNPKEI